MDKHQVKQNIVLLKETLESLLQSMNAIDKALSEDNELNVKNSHNTFETNIDALDEYRKRLRKALYGK